MSQVAKLFMHGRSQAERLPVAFRFNTDEVFIRQDPETWGVILSRKTESLDGFLAALKEVEVPADFLRSAERQQGEQNRDPLAGWAEGLAIGWTPTWGAACGKKIRWRSRLTKLADEGVASGAEKVLTKNEASFIALVDARKRDYYHALEEAHAGLVLLDEANIGLR